MEFLKIEFWKKKLLSLGVIIFFSLCPPRGTQGFLQEMLDHSFQPFGQLQGTCIRMSCFYYIDIIECRVYINKTKPGAATRWVYFYRFYCHIRVLFNIQLTQYLSDLGLQEAAIWGSMLDSLSDLQLIWFDNLCVSVCLSIYISIYLYLSISIFLYLSFCIYLSIYIYVSISIDLYPSI